MPQEMTTPRRLDNTGRSTAASLGPSLAMPTNGLMTLPPCTSWSYWRMTHSLLATFSDPRIASSVSPASIPREISDFRFGIWDLGFEMSDVRFEISDRL